jgi:hypothetical protein
MLTRMDGRRTATEEFAIGYLRLAISFEPLARMSQNGDCVLRLGSVTASVMLLD